MSELNTIQSTINYIKKELQDTYPVREIESISYILLEHVLKCPKINIQLDRNANVEQRQLEQIYDCVAELKSHRPIQYILGETEFYGLHFKLNQHILIPRPETEELVHAIIKENIQPELTVLDIGTGSGSIPISLAKNMKRVKVSSIDISPEAIKVARENAKINNVEVGFYHRDILNWKNYQWGSYDVIVSNPPYVRELEKKQMEQNVLGHEPQLALFVPDDNPLLFYRVITDFALLHLKNKGKLYFEINENLGKEMVELISDKGLIDIRLLQDINGKDRVLSAIKPF